MFRQNSFIRSFIFFFQNLSSKIHFSDPSEFVFLKKDVFSYLEEQKIIDCCVIIGPPSSHDLKKNNSLTSYYVEDFDLLFESLFSKIKKNNFVVAIFTQELTVLNKYVRICQIANKHGFILIFESIINHRPKTSKDIIRDCTARCLCFTGPDTHYNKKLVSHSTKVIECPGKFKNGFCPLTCCHVMDFFKQNKVEKIINLCCGKNTAGYIATKYFGLPCTGVDLKDYGIKDPILKHYCSTAYQEFIGAFFTNFNFSIYSKNTF